MTMPFTPRIRVLAPCSTLLVFALACSTSPDQRIEENGPDLDSAPPKHAGEPVSLRSGITPGLELTSTTTKRIAGEPDQRSVLQVRWDEVSAHQRATRGQVRIVEDRLLRDGKWRTTRHEGLTLLVEFEGAAPRLILQEENVRRDVTGDFTALRSRIRALSGRTPLLPDSGRTAIGEVRSIPLRQWLQATTLENVLRDPTGSVSATVSERGPGPPAWVQIQFEVDLQSRERHMAVRLRGSARVHQGLGVAVEEQVEGTIQVGGGARKAFATVGRVTFAGVAHRSPEKG